MEAAIDPGTTVSQLQLKFTIPLSGCTRLDPKGFNGAAVFQPPAIEPRPLADVVFAIPLQILVRRLPVLKHGLAVHQFGGLLVGSIVGFGPGLRAPAGEVQIKAEAESVVIGVRCLIDAFRRSEVTFAPVSATGYRPYLIIPSSGARKIHAEIEDPEFRIWL
jgi:hypothetical protein